MRELNDVPAPAKLNLFLHVTGRRDDGYHEVQTLYRLLDYGDRLDFATRADGRIQVHCDVAAGEVDEKSNLVTRAATLLKKAAGVESGADVKVRKRVPPGSGLGGGSSDAATTLRALNALWNCGLGVERLSELGLSLGADVPVFVHGRSAWAEGVGERLAPVALPAAWYLVLLPPVKVSTSKLFAAPELTRSTAPITMGDYRSGAAVNVFEPLARRRFPPVAEALDWLKGHCEARAGVGLSGTGCAVFAEFSDREQAASALTAALANGPETVGGFTARGLNVSPLVEHLGTMATQGG